MARYGTKELTGTLLDERAVFTLRELCRACGVHAELVIELAGDLVISLAERTPSDRARLKTAFLALFGRRRS